MTTVKRVILFLFGIVLIVFGNKAAIDTIFKNKDGLKEVDSNGKEAEVKNPIITEEIEVKEPEVSTSKVADKVSKEDTVKVTKTKSIVKDVKEQPTKVTKAIEEQKAQKAPETKIEPVQEESAAASE